MSDRGLARRTKIKVYFAGVDISEDINRYLMSLAYVDNDEDEADDLKITLEDRDNIWLCNWLNVAVSSVANKTEDSRGLEIRASIVRQNWYGDGADQELETGIFELDSIEASGPPAGIVISATSLPFASTVRQTKKSKAWEGYWLSRIANEIAASNGMSCMYESAYDPYYDRVEQTAMSDILFLSQLCKNTGLSLKATSGMLVLFDESAYEAMPPVRAIYRGAEGEYTKYRLRSGSADTQYTACHVSYTDPITGQKIEFTYKPDETGSTGRVLVIYEKVTSIAEAQKLAMKRLRQKNKFERTADFTFPGDPDLVAGVTVALSGWGAFDGKYIIKQAKHNVSSSGYTTSVRLRKILEGY